MGVFGSSNENAPQSHTSKGPMKTPEESVLSLAEIEAEVMAERRE